MLRIFFALLFVILGYNEIIAKSKDIVINKVVDLKGDTLTLKLNENLKFIGNGKIINGTLVGNNSSISAKDEQAIFSNIYIEGKWTCSKSYSSWFEWTDSGLTNRAILQSLFNLSGDECQGDIYISEGTYPVAIISENSEVASINSNTKIHLNGHIVLEPNAFERYAIFALHNKEKIVIDGKGKIIGDVEHHKGDKGEWGFGIKLFACNDICIRDLSVEKCWGDCICLGHNKPGGKISPQKIRIDNVTCIAGRRQGISICAGKNITVNKCTLSDIGSIKSTPPSAGIDIEPDSRKEIMKNITIQSCQFSGNGKSYGGDLQLYNMNEQCDVLIKKCNFSHSLVIADGAGNLVVDECVINKLVVYDKAANILIKNSEIRNGPSFHSNVKFKYCKFRQVNTAIALLAISLPLVIGRYYNLTKE